MKVNKEKIKDFIRKLGEGLREIYLQQNPHGYSSVNKVHKSKKTYNRKNKNKWQSQ
jgi:hypothetical protein